MENSKIENLGHITLRKSRLPNKLPNLGDKNYLEHQDFLANAQFLQREPSARDVVAESTRQRKISVSQTPELISSEKDTQMPRKLPSAQAFLTNFKEGAKKYDAAVYQLSVPSLVDRPALWAPIFWSILPYILSKCFGYYEFWLELAHLLLSLFWLYLSLKRND